MKDTMLHIAVLLAGIVACVNTDLSAQSFSVTDSLKASFENQADAAVRDFEAYASSAYEDYMGYLEKARAEYAAYVDAIETVWGGYDSKESTRYEWVEYSEDFRSRSVVDFDQGTASIQVKIGPDEESDTSAINRKLVSALERLLQSRGSSCPYSSDVDLSGPLTDKPVLHGLLDLAQYDFSPAAAEAERPVPKNTRPAPPSPTVKGSRLDVPTSVRRAPKDSSARPTMAAKAIDARKRAEQEKAARLAARQAAEASARQAASEHSVADTAAVIVADSHKEISEADENGNRTVTISLNLIANNLSTAAALYKDLVAEFSEDFSIEPALIFAVIEQESRFNPQAESWVPAYGLMQLVPVSGGFDAYRFVYGNEWIPTKSYLFIPRNNIELGTAYLRVLMNQFAPVKDPDCRRLCVIAGYNTGAGNVSRAFTGSTNVSRALPLINTYDYESLYEHLTSHLSTAEARNYVSGVSKRRSRYL